MNPEHRLNCAIIVEQDITPVLDAKVTTDFFSNAEDRQVFTWIREHWSKYGQVPGTASLKNNFPNYKIIKGREPYEYYLDEVRRRRRYGLLFETVADATDLLEDDQPDEAKDRLAAGILHIDTEVSELRDTNITVDWEQRLERYAEWKKFGHTLKGIPSGFPTIDDGLRGFQPEQLITFVGAPKAGKSWMMLMMALAAQQHGKRPLFIGFEMSNEEQEARHDAIVSEISYGNLLKGRTTEEEEERLNRELKRRRNGEDFIMSSDPSGSTVSGIAAKIEQFKPDIVFIDGVYMMDDEEGEDRGTPQALTNITRSLKRLARRRKIPIVISTQVLLWKLNKKKGLDEAAIGYTSSFIQDSDVVLGVENSNSDNPNDPVKRVKVVLARTAPKFDVLLFWDWERTTVREMSYEGGEVDVTPEPEPDDETKKKPRKKKTKFIRKPKED